MNVNFNKEIRLWARMQKGHVKKLISVSRAGVHVRNYMESVICEPIFPKWRGAKAVLKL